MVVNHNMASICESRQLRYNVKKMEVSSKKLATGYKIIGANDDAAGLQISETMRHQTRGLNKASRNSQDGISMLQTADAALQETQDVLGRMVELTTQAANDTHTDADRRSIQDEIDQLIEEIDRVAETTKFNETYLLKGGKDTQCKILNSYDAGLKGDMYDDGGATATFTTNLKVGDSVSIAGKEYNIISDRNKTDAKERISNIQDQIKK